MSGGYVPGEPNVLFTMNVGDNAHQTASMINAHLPELVDYVLQIEFGGSNSIVLFRAPASLIAKLKEAKRI